MSSFIQLTTCRDLSRQRPRQPCPDGHGRLALPVQGQATTPPTSMGRRVVPASCVIRDNVDALDTPEPGLDERLAAIAYTALRLHLITDQVAPFGPAPSESAEQRYPRPLGHRPPVERAALAVAT